MRRARAIAAELAPPVDLAPARVGAAPRRVHFVDLLRLIASVQMIVGHTLDGLLTEELRRGALFDRWTWVRGLTSVSFLFAAGLSFHLSTIARFDAHRANRSSVLKRLRRGAWLVVLGYLLHFPAGVFGGDAAAALREFAIADVLQCIGVSILALEALVLALPSRRHVVAAAGLLGVALIALAPLGDRIDPSGPWRFALNYLSHRGGSLFPLLPWAGFVMAGVVVAELALPQGNRTDPDAVPRRLTIATAALVGVALLAAWSPWTLLAEGASRNAEPAFNLTKLAVVVAVVTALSMIGRRIVRLPRVARILAGETLMLYVFHLLVLYAGGVGLYRLLGHSLSFGAASSFAVAMVALSAAVALAWHRFKAARGM